MGMVSAFASDEQDIIEFQGDRYVIHVDRMNPDDEMTLLDVLNTCPEFLSLNGKKIDINYKLRINNVDLVIDSESFLTNVTTQLPYALTAAIVSFFTFLVAGFTKSALISLVFGIVALLLLLLFIHHRQRLGKQTE